MTVDITSFSNPKIKDLVKLQTKKRERDKKGLIVIEGKQEIELAWQNGIKIKELFQCPEWDNKGTSIKRANFPIFQVSKQVFAKASYREHPDGFLAVAVPPADKKLRKIKMSPKPLLLVLEGVEKPGNLGAILRTADAAGVDAVIINQEKTDIYNPNVIRTSRGSVFSKQIVTASRGETISWLQDNKIQTIATVVDAEKNYTEVNLKRGSALVMGEESQGLSRSWQEQADQKVVIPMQGQVNSLNVSVSAAILTFEAVRQRSEN